MELIDGVIYDMASPLSVHQLIGGFIYTKLMNHVFEKGGSCVYGSPDFIIEILSSSTKKKDSFLKLNKYMNAGVREYWIIDPQKKNVVVYDFENDDYPVLYGFDSKVPIRIWNNECVIDFNELYDHIRFLYE